MAKADKEFYWRMQGMIYALKIAKEEGIDALERNIRNRNVLEAPFNMDEKAMQKFYKKISDVLYTNMLSAFLYTLHDAFEFDGEKLKLASEEFTKNTEAINDLDYMGQHYVRLQDYAEELNQKYNLGINAELIADCEKEFDKAEGKINYCNIDRVIEVLKMNGYDDATAFLESRLVR